MATRRKTRPARSKARRASATSGKRTAARSHRATARLPEYEAKRDFEVTTEPAPGTAAPNPDNPTFVVHKHDATRLHYDVRLELDGALASWAVPKGPSFDPSIKRLAVQTEDHPLEYGSFEGRIPDGEYGAGDSLIWDRGTYRAVGGKTPSEQRKKGHLEVEFFGEKLKGRFHLVRTRPTAGGKSQWLMFKAHDELADPKYDPVADRPESVVSGRRVTRGPERVGTLRKLRAPPESLLKKVFPPMLATLVGAPPPDPDNWVFELKYDGYRALAAVSGGEAAMWTRNGLDLRARFPTIARALERLKVGDAVFDGEIVVLDAKGAPRFQLLQTGENAEAHLYVFDLLWLDGEDLRKRPLEDRRDLLASVLANPPPDLHLSERMDGDVGEALRDSLGRGFEGLIGKRRGSRYESTRSREWIKLKGVNSQEAAIVGFTPSEASPNQLGSLLLGVMDHGALTYAGRVGTGFSAKQRVELRRRLLEDRVDSAPAKGAPRMRRATWVEPRLVCEVEFTEWTGDGKLRHPSFKGLRPDKKPEDCAREKAAAVQPKRERKATDSEPTAKGPRATPTESRVTLSNPQKLLFPKDGVTKQDYADYLEAMADPLLRALKDRPISFQRWTAGIHSPSFFQQSVGKEGQDWMTYAVTPTSTSRGHAKHLIVDQLDTLRWLAQYSVLTIHMWSSRQQHPKMPDWVVFDLDPADHHGIEQTIAPARVLKQLFDELSIPCYPKTSGKRGLHVFVPLAPGHTHEDAVEFALSVGRTVEQVLPEVVTLERSKAKRHGRLYLDCLQNGYGKTVVAPYSPRAIDGAPVSAPLRWSEVTEDLDPMRFTLETMPKRLAREGDLFRPALERGVRLPRLK